MAFEKSKVDPEENRIQKALNPDTVLEPENLKAYSVRLSQSDIDSLKTHFTEKGLKLGQGLRMIIREYLNKFGG